MSFLAMPMFVLTVPYSTSTSTSCSCFIPKGKLFYSIVVLYCRYLKVLVHLIMLALRTEVGAAATFQSVYAFWDHLMMVSGVMSDYYKILEVDYDATDEKIRLNYRMLALKWHPDKHLGDSAVTAKFQDINEAYKAIDDAVAMFKGSTLITSACFILIFSSAVLSDPAKRFEYDLTGIYEIDKYTVREYLARFKGMILTCNGLGISNTSTW
ncbi:hypothetical protein POTOM_044266 [Populus tomentosa]|uniref:J domain-containing protein n=1 Tax=Populus tomentosa TaxID=118781 RepID=A0A8X7YVT8_POPTO|nr:hypothetical protein POTOM_044266 [Populus tomentosa]